MGTQIDDILNDIFEADSKTGKSKAAMEAEAFLANIEKRQKGIFDKNSEDIFKQMDEIEKINNESKRQIEEIQSRIEEDGFTESVSKSEERENKDINSIFESVKKLTLEEIKGQEEFVSKLILAFKRPYVMGVEEDKPKSTIIITGKNGTGRHSAVNFVTKLLSEKELLKGKEPFKIDLSVYDSPDEAKLFVQDVFSAVKSESSVLLFENYDKCHKSILNNLSDMASKAVVQLNSRYAEQKGMLIDVGTALVAKTINSISCQDKYLVFLTGDYESKIANNMGSVFMESVSDICSTKEFENEDLEEISKDKFDKFAKKCLDKLKFKINSSEEIYSYFKSKFTLKDGINAIEDYADICYKELSEYKLLSSALEMEFSTKITENCLEFISAKKIIKIETRAEDSEEMKEVKAQLDEIVGLDSVKEFIFSVEDNYKLSKIRGEKGLKNSAISMHMIFTGNPGTGKTTIARMVTRYFKAIGMLTGGQLIEVTRADLVGRYVGHTAPLTKQVIQSAIGGVLFIDEAYSLYRGKEDSFGLECIDMLVKGMEDHRDNLIVILAGYTLEMQEFLKANSGLVSRFPNVIEFQDYSSENLWDITKIIVKSKGYKLSDDCKDELMNYYHMKQSVNSRVAGNGRMVRNLVENAVLNQSKRILSSKSENYEELLLEDFELNQ